MTEQIDKLPLIIDSASIIAVIIAGVGGVLLTNYLQNRRLKNALINETASRLSVLEASVSGSLKNFQTQINGNGKLNDEKLKRLVSWEKYDHGITRVHKKMEEHAREQRQCLQEISASMQQIEIATTEIGARMESQQRLCEERREWIEKLERRIDKHERMS